MADWSKLALESMYANFVTEVSSRDTDLAVGFDPAVVTPTNIPTNTIRWRSAASKWEEWNGTVWSDLATTYAINISGTASNVTGVVAAANGGSGQSSYTVGDLLYASGAAALSKLAAVATGNVLRSGGVATAPSWGKVALTTDVSGVLPVANGGTGVPTLTGVPYGNGTGAMTAATAAQLVAIIGSTAVSNATTAENANTVDGYHAAAFVRSVNGNVPDGTGNVAVSSGVTSVNGNAGAITAAQIAAAATAGYGYTPARANAPVTVEFLGSYSLSSGQGAYVSMDVYSNFGYGIYFAIKTGGDSAEKFAQNSCIAFESATGITAYNSATTSGTKTIYFNLYRMRNL